MTTTRGKWEPSSRYVSVGFRGSCIPTIRRLVRSSWFGFVRESWEVQDCERNTDCSRLCRVLNDEPEPAPRPVALQDRIGCSGHYPNFRFSSEELRAELERRGELRKKGGRS